PGNWAGTPHFQTQGHLLLDPTVNQTLQYLHWAGFRIQPGCPYWEVWEYYRHLNPSLPPAVFEVPIAKSQFGQILDKLKHQMRRLKTS
nr:methionine synthase [Nostocaceae cyanobacterium]